MYTGCDPNELVAGIEMVEMGYVFQEGWVTYDGISENSNATYTPNDDYSFTDGTNSISIRVCQNGSWSGEGIPVLEKNEYECNIYLVQLVTIVFSKCAFKQEKDWCIPGMFVNTERAIPVNLKKKKFAICISIVYICLLHCFRELECILVLLISGNVTGDTQQLSYGAAVAITEVLCSVVSFTIGVSWEHSSSTSSLEHRASLPPHHTHQWPRVRRWIFLLL